MADLEVIFAAHAEKIRNLEKAPCEEDFKLLYGLYKQAMYGNNYTAKPNINDKKDTERWEAWISNRGLSKEDAMRKYVKEAKLIISKN